MHKSLITKLDNHDSNSDSDILENVTDNKNKQKVNFLYNYFFVE